MSDLRRAINPHQKRESPGRCPRLSPTPGHPHTYLLAGTQLVLSLSYLNPGALFNASLVVSIVR